MQTPSLPAGVEAAYVVTRPPTWRTDPLTLSYLLLGFQPTGDQLAETYRWAKTESLANPRVISPATLEWSQFFNPRFFAAVRDAHEIRPRLRPTHPDALHEGLGLTRLWAESLLFLAGVTMSAAIVQSRWSPGTLASKYDRLWQAGQLGTEGVLPELSGLSLQARVCEIATGSNSDIERLIAVRSLFSKAVGSLVQTSSVEVATMDTKGLSAEMANRFGFIADLRDLLGNDLVAVVVYGSSVNSDSFADYDLLIVSRSPEVSLTRMAGLNPTWRGKELNVGVYSPSELWNMQLLSGDNLADYGLCVLGEVEVPIKPTRRLLARNFSFGMIRQRQQLGMIPMALEHPNGRDGDDLRSLYEYFVKIPANVVKGTLAVGNSQLTKELVYRWLRDRCGFDTTHAQRRARACQPAEALCEAAVATASALDALNQEFGLLAYASDELSAVMHT